MPDWGLAIKIGATGFLMVVAVLSVVALVVWLTGMVIRRTGTGGGKNSEKKGD